MELIRRKSDYALRSLAYMAKSPLNKRFTIVAIANKQKIPSTFLKKIFQKLSKDGIVRSERGPLGGFYLVRRPSQITLREILESMQGRVSLSDCLFVSSLCWRPKTCRVKEGLYGIQDRLDSLLERYTLRDFVK